MRNSPLGRDDRAPGASVIDIGRVAYDEVPEIAGEIM
jgi:hypothetical protein